MGFSDSIKKGLGAAKGLLGAKAAPAASSAASQLMKDRSVLKANPVGGYAADALGAKPSPNRLTGYLPKSPK